MVYGYHMPPVVKTTVYLGAEEYDRLKAVARREGRTAAELVREAVHRYTNQRRRGLRLRSLGAGHSRTSDLSERAESLLDGMGRPR